MKLMGPAVIYALSLSEVGHHSDEFHQSVNGIRTARMSLEVNDPTAATWNDPDFLSSRGASRAPNARHLIVDDNC
ncbi:hypothetical protein FOCG_07636 [Fusarium oxysporum f. sp. radicis-lycopersici 26381]|nr:hypothetical protein FOWG_11813 [Fusarium oxysporum f. sp. lycopersici MN25]EXL51815.1 hypothetical protein FOCG_07636 [Fusarium oxysporum f. sp. radicis-lycopersici 26381]